jgi:hypothetical protein
MKRASVSLLISLVFVAACSGGAGSYNNANPPPPAGFDITPTNAMQVSQVAYQSVVTSGDIAGLAGSSGLTANSGGNFSKPTLDARGTFASLLQKIPFDPTSVQAPFGPTSLPCAVSGSLTISGDLANPLTLSAGDTIRADYDNCNDGLGETIDGTLDFIVDVFAGDIFTGLYDMTMTMDLIDFQSTTANDVLLANGDATATLNTMAAPYVEASVSGNSMTTNTNGTSESLTAYSSAQTLDAGLDPAPYTMIASGTLDSSQLSGAITYSTPVMFEGLGSDYPHAGELLVAGSDSSIRLIAVDNVNVRIEIYSNVDGTGTPDDTILTTWAELASMQ